MTATKSRTRKPAASTHGVCRLIPACNLPLADALDAGEAMLTITPERGAPASYTVLRLANGVGFRLTRLADYIVDRKVYDIDATANYGWQCDCPDAQFRSHECKHVRALRNALAQAGIALPVAVKPDAEPIELDDL